MTVPICNVVCSSLVLLVADDFKPASIDTLQPAVIDIEQGNKVKVTVPHIEVGFSFICHMWVPGL